MPIRIQHPELNIEAQLKCCERRAHQTGHHQHEHTVQQFTPKWGHLLSLQVAPLLLESGSLLLLRGHLARQTLKSIERRLPSCRILIFRKGAPVISGSSARANVANEVD